MGLRGGGAGSGGIGRLAPGFAGAPVPTNDVLEKRFDKHKGMIAGYSTVQEAIEGGKKIFGRYTLGAESLTDLKAHKEIQSAMLENATMYRVPLQTLRIGEGRSDMFAHVSFSSADGKTTGINMNVNPEFFQRGYKYVRKEGSMWNAPGMVTSLSKNPRKALIDHEFAHVLQRRQLGAKGMKKMEQSKSIYRGDRSISRYSTKNRLEEHAEAFAAHKMGMRSRRIDRILRSLKPDS